jgi:hypothetical protein
MKLVFGKKYIQHDSNFFKNEKIDGEPDYYVRNGNKIFLFENKDVLLNAKIKTSSDLEKILDELKRKFLIDSKKIKKKAILQLTNNIVRILKKELPDKNYKKQNVTIYPILVVHERLFSSEGINFFLNRWFQNELKMLQNVLITGKIKPLTIVNIDTFVNYHEIFEKNIFKLHELLDEYFKTTSPERKTKTEDQLIEKYTSFSVFIENKFKSIKHIPKIFYTKGHSIID